MVVVFIIFSIYTGIIVSFILGYYRVIERKPIPTATSSYISVVVCLRNEATNIESLFTSLWNQDYPLDDFEVVAVNDHSEDETLALLLEQQKHHSNLRVVSLGPSEKGKKSALHKGILSATGNVVAITDADCTHPTTWLTQISYYMSNHTDMVCGPVAYSTSNLFEKLSAIEFGSLVASGIGAAGNGKPIFCNGANMAFKKELFFAANLNSDITPSGDDVFLLQYARHSSRSVQFAHGANVCVATAADRNLSDLINRRVRWGSKTPYYTDSFAKLVAIITLLANFSLIALAVASLLSSSALEPLLVLFAIKLAVDFSLISIHFKSCNQKKWRRYYLIAAAIYPFYITFTALLSLRKEFTWKERYYS